jgi:hypothetical protein
MPSTAMARAIETNASPPALKVFLLSRRVKTSA